ncbi:MAG: alpha/beta hydrolase [Gammaproteobacteria bacterium]
MPLPPNIDFFVKSIYEQNIEQPTDIRRHRDEWRAILASLNIKNSEVADVKDISNEKIQLRIYTPYGVGPFPILIYYPGGAFVYSELSSHDMLCRDICAKSRYVVINVKTRVAPEHTPEEGLEDAYQALRWCIEHANELAGSPDAIILSGDSSGGNFAALVAIRAAINNLSNVKGQLLLMPATDLARTGESHRIYDKGYLLDRVDWFYDFYIPKGVDRKNPRISPLYADIPSNMAPAKIIFATYDPLADDAKLYYQHLQAAGILVTLEEAPVIHGMHLFESVIDTMAYPQTAMRSRLITALNDFKTILPLPAS